MNLTSKNHKETSGRVTEISRHKFYIRKQFLKTSTPLLGLGKKLLILHKREHNFFNFTCIIF